MKLSVIRPWAKQAALSRLSPHRRWEWFQEKKSNTDRQQVIDMGCFHNRVNAQLCFRASVQMYHDMHFCPCDDVNIFLKLSGCANRGLREAVMARTLSLSD